MEIADSLDRCVGTERATASASSAPLGAAALYARLQVGDSGDAEEPAAKRQRRHEPQGAGCSVELRPSGGESVLVHCSFPDS